MIEGIVGIFLFLAGSVEIAWLADAISGSDEQWTFIIFWVIVIGIFVYYNDQQKGKKRKTDTTIYSRYSLSYPSNWDEFRQSVLRRDKFRCGNCRTSRNLDVHHIVPRVQGGTDQINNLKTLCLNCHRKFRPWM